MANRTNPPPWTYPEAVALAGCEAAVSAAWVGAAGLPPWQRRLARTTVTALSAGLAAGLYRLERARTGPVPVRTEPDPEPEPGSGPSAWQRPGAVLEATAVAGAIAVMLSSPLVQKRWLRGLARSGHRHPHRSLALRIGAVSFASALPARLIEAHQAAEAQATA